MVSPAKQGKCRYDLFHSHDGMILSMAAQDYLVGCTLRSPALHCAKNTLVLPRKFTGGICCGSYLAITYGGEL